MAEADLKQLVTEQAKVIQTLQHQVGVLEDIAELRNLQHAYGYYLDKCQYRQVAELFLDDEETEARFFGGLYKGIAGVKRLYLGTFQQQFTKGRNGPINGFLLDHPQLQDIIHVSKDRLTAKMRARVFMTSGRHVDYGEPAGGTPRQWWEGGMYENQYARKSVSDPWQIWKLDYQPIWHGEFEKGWAHTKPNFIPFPTKTYPEDPNGPDALQEADKMYLWPETHTLPYHYAHPITGKNLERSELRAVDMKD